MIGSETSQSDVASLAVPTQRSKADTSSLYKRDEQHIIDPVRKAQHRFFHSTLLQKGASMDGLLRL